MFLFRERKLLEENAEKEIEMFVQDKIEEGQEVAYLGLAYN